MKKIIGLTLAALLVLAMVGGGTWAYFSDTEASTNNTLTAGTLDLKVDSLDTPVTTFSATGTAPGQSGSGATTLKNSGSLSGSLSVATSNVTNTGGAGGTEFEDGVGNLGGVAKVAIYIDVDENGSWSAGDIGLKNDGNTYAHPTALDSQTIDSYASKTWSSIETMASNATDKLHVDWQIPTSTGNNIQGDSVKFDFTFTLDQEFQVVRITV